MADTTTVAEETLHEDMLQDLDKKELIRLIKQNEKRATKEAERAAKAEDANLKLTDKLKKSVLSDKDKREITLAVKTTATDIMDPVRYEQLRILARDMYASGNVPKTYENEAQVFSAMQIGQELGMGPREAILNGYFIDGRYEIWGKAVGALLRRKGWRWNFYDESQEETNLEIWHKDEPDYKIRDTYTYEEAELSGFTTYNNKYTGKEEDKLGWRPGSNRKRKLRYGVLSLVLHTYLPDVLGAATGIAEYSEDYLEAQAAMDQPGENDKADKKDAINKAMASYNKRPLEEVKPRAVETAPSEGTDSPAPEEGDQEE